MSFDLAVVGGGPVGLVTALYARQAGLRVMVIEQRSGEIDKACGEGVMPEALERLAQLGVDPPGRDFFGIRYISKGHAAQARFTSAPGRGIRRVDLWRALEHRARSAGVELMNARVRELVQGNVQVEVAGVTARYAVGADGLHSRVRQLLGVELPGHGTHRFGVRRHFAVAPWTDLVEVYWLPTAEVYVTPIASNQVGVAVLGSRPLSLSSAIAQVPSLSTRLRGAVAVTDELGAGPLLQRTRARTSGRVLLVGDAAGYVDALTGEGLRMGFAEAEAAVDAIVHEDVAGYEASWQRITASYRRLTSGLLWAAKRPLLRGLIVPAAQVFPAAFRRGVDAIGA